MKRNRENNIDFITDGYTSEKLMEIIDEIRLKYDIINAKKIYKEGDKEYIDIANNYKFFKERYPFLFDMILKPDMDKNKLNYLINMRENIVNNKISFEKASEKVGTTMYNEFHKK